MGAMWKTESLRASKFRHCRGCLRRRRSRSERERYGGPPASTVVTESSCRSSNRGKPGRPSPGPASTREGVPFRLPWIGRRPAEAERSGPPTPTPTNASDGSHHGGDGRGARLGRDR